MADVLQLDDSTKNAVAGIANGTLADEIGSTMKYSITGIFVGMALGILIASLTGNSRMLFGLCGGIAGGGVGMLVNPSNK